jgi:peroxiredoxin
VPAYVRKIVVALAVAVLALAIAEGAPVVVPSELRDVTGAAIDVAALASERRLVFVTVKATWCPVCRVQLQRLSRLLPRLRACDASFVVLVPGETEAVAALARDTSFPYPFVAERAVALAAAAGFASTADELVPGFFAVDRTRAIVWEQRGRGAGSYGDAELLTYLGCGGPADPDLMARR